MVAPTRCHPRRTPLHITGVQFSVAPNNTFDVSVTAEEVNDRTEKTVRGVVNEINKLRH